jgi:hypothetical protein
MPLIYSPLSDEVISLPPHSLFPRHAFIMRQIGSAPGIDRIMTGATLAVLKARGFAYKDADASTAAKDFLARILGLVRSTGLTIAIFSAETRDTALANIMLELGFAAMCGKPLMIVKSKDAAAPSDLTRTDWIDYDPDDIDGFERKIGQALDEVEKVAQLQEMLLDLALEAPSMDCAVALERALKAFLLTGDETLLDKAEQVRNRVAAVREVQQVDDLNRLHDEVAMFVKLGRKCQPISH